METSTLNINFITCSKAELNAKQIDLSPAFPNPLSMTIFIMCVYDS